MRISRPCLYGSNLMCSEACLTLSLVIRFSELCGAFPNAKLIRCSRSSSSVAGTFRDASNIFANSGSGFIVLRNCCRSAMKLYRRDEAIHFFFPQYSPIFSNRDSQLINAPRSPPPFNPGSFSSHISCTLITDTQPQSRNNSPTVQHRKLRPSPETDPLFATNHFGGSLKIRMTNTQISSGNGDCAPPKSPRQTAASPAKSLFM